MIIARKKYNVFDKQSEIIYPTIYICGHNRKQLKKVENKSLNF